MNLRVRWSIPAGRALKKVPRGDAERIAAAVLRFAETSEGEPERLDAGPGVNVRLHVGGYVIMVTVSMSDATVWVAWLYRSDR